MVLFAVPGAFTPTCNNNHLPGFLKNADAFKGKGIDTIAVTGVNDMFVFDAWKKSSGAAGKIEFLSDGNGEFAKALDMTMDGSGFGLGLRSKRYAMLVEDGVVKKLNVEDVPSKAESSGAERFAQAMSLIVARASGGRIHGVRRRAHSPARARNLGDGLTRQQSARSFMS